MSRRFSLPLVLVAVSLAMGTPALAQGERAKKDPAAAPGKAPAKKGPSRAQKAERLLQKAYQKEYAFLAAQKRSLEQRLKELEARTAREKARQQKARASLESQLLADQLLADRLEEEVSRTQMSADERESTDDVLESVLSQMEASARRHQASIPELSEDQPAAASIGVLFESLAGVLKERAKVTREKGAFFDREGKKVEGTLVHLGGVASFGVAESAAGALAPAGAGTFKLWPDSGPDEARALLAGSTPAVVPAFLYESTDKAVEKRHEKTPLEVVEAGGAIAWVIVGLGTFGLLLILTRGLLLALLGWGRRRLLEKVIALVASGQVEEARVATHQASGSMARVLKAAVVGLRLPRDEREDRIGEAVLVAVPQIDRFGSIILVIAAVAPLLGLLGTVTGMIATFDAITEFGTGDPRMLSGGISEALITTELGLIVAIPTLLLGNLLSGWGERLKRDLDIGGLKVSNLALSDSELDLDEEVAAPVAPAFGPPTLLADDDITAPAAAGAS